MNKKMCVGGIQQNIKTSKHHFNLPIFFRVEVEENGWLRECTFLDGKKKDSWRWTNPQSRAELVFEKTIHLASARSC